MRGNPGDHRASLHAALGGALRQDRAAGRVLLLRRQHHQRRVPAQAREAQQRGLRLAEVDLEFQARETPYQGLESGSTRSVAVY